MSEGPEWLACFARRVARWSNPETEVEGGLMTRFDRASRPLLSLSRQAQHHVAEGQGNRELDFQQN